MTEELPEIGVRPTLDTWSPRRILCGVDASRGSREAVDQAITLAGPSAVLDFAFVSWATGTGATAMAAVDPTRARAALADAVRQAGEAGLTAHEQVVRDNHKAEAIMRLARDADLLVLGTEPHSRAGGIATGSVATAAAHRSPCDVVIARPAPDQRPFPRDVLLAFDGSASAWRAASIAAVVTERHGANLSIVAAGRSTPERRHALAEVAVGLTQTTGREPVIAAADGDAGERIVDLARELGASLVVLGSRHLTGVRALGSVSERVAHGAHCSVLIARGTTTPA